MITASHNPPSDNGFKCYSSTGGQVIPPDDRGIIECVEAASDREIPEKPMEEGLADGSIVWVGPELDDAYIASVVSESVSHARDLSIVYTPLARRGRDLGGRRAADRRVRPGPHPRIPAHARRRLPDRARATSPTPSIPGRWRRPSRRPGAEVPTS